MLYPAAMKSASTLGQVGDERDEPEAARSCAQIARNEAEVAKCTKLKREPQAVCCPPPDGDEVSVGTRQREYSDQVIARISSGKLANLANSVSEKIDAGTAVSSDWSRGFPSLSLRYRL